MFTMCGARASVMPQPDTPVMRTRSPGPSDPEKPSKIVRPSNAHRKSFHSISISNMEPTTVTQTRENIL